MKKKLLLFTIIIVPFLLGNNSEAKRLNSLSGKNIVKKDTVYVLDHKNSSDNISFSKKEITNILLTRNTTENALSIFITALGVLFTLMAIVVAIVIFMQSRDFKNKLTEATDKYQLIIKQFIDSKREDLKMQEENITKLILEYKEKLETSQPLIQETQLAQETEPIQESESKKSESKIKEIITELEQKRNIIEKQLNNSIVDVEYVAKSSFLSGEQSSLPNKHHQCSNCKFGFLIHNFDLGKGSAIYTYNPYGTLNNTQKVVTCPKCGNVDTIY